MGCLTLTSKQVRRVVSLRAYLDSSGRSKRLRILHNSLTRDKLNNSLLIFSFLIEIRGPTSAHRPSPFSSPFSVGLEFL